MPAWWLLDYEQGTDAKEFSRFSLNGWAGDHAGEVVGRKRNTLIIGTSVPAGSQEAFAPFLTSETWFFFEVGGLKIYPDILVNCLTPDARRAVVTDVEKIGYLTWALGITDVRWSIGPPGEPWELGVHLFSVAINDPRPQSAIAGETTLATAIISEKRAGPVDLTNPDQASEWIEGMDRAWRRNTPARFWDPRRSSSE